MRDFGNAEGCSHSCGPKGWRWSRGSTSSRSTKVVGLLIYRDNMRHRFVAVPLQSVILFLTLMFGPVGFLAYYVARVSNRRGGWVAWGDASAPAKAARAASRASIRFAERQNAIDHRDAARVVAP